jgi:hypothetical protein
MARHKLHTAQDLPMAAASPKRQILQMPHRRRGMKIA